MTTITLEKTIDGTLRPLTDQDRENLKRWKTGDIAIMDLIKPRNGKFHRKFMAMVNLAFEYWEPEEVEHKGEMITPGKDFDEFRKWLTILAGYKEIIGYPDGSVRVRAKSLKFDKMDDMEFGRLYNNIINVILQKVLTTFESKAAAERVANEILQFG